MACRFGPLAVQALCSPAIVGYFRRHRGGIRCSTLVAPFAGVALMAFAACPLLANRGALGAADRVPFVQAIPWTVLAVFAASAGAAVRLRVRDTARYQALGRVVVYEADPVTATDRVSNPRSAASA